MLERINLVPQLPLSERIRRALLPVIGAMLCLVTLFLAANNKLFQSRINAVEQKIALANRNAEAASTLQTQIAGLAQAVAAKREEIKRLGSRADQLGCLQARKKHHSRILTVIAQALPESIRCNKITFQDNGGIIAGTALQYGALPLFIKALETDPTFAVVNLHDLDRSTEGDKAEFNFTVTFALK